MYHCRLSRDLLECNMSVYRGNCRQSKDAESQCSAQLACHGATFQAILPVLWAQNVATLRCDGVENLLSINSEWNKLDKIDILKMSEQRFECFPVCASNGCISFVCGQGIRRRFSRQRLGHASKADRFYRLSSWKFSHPGQAVAEFEIGSFCMCNSGYFEGAVMRVENKM